MANRCAGLDPTWAHFPTPAPTHTAHAAAASHYYCSSSPAWLITSAAALENEALTSALRASMAPAHAYSYSYSAAAASSFSSPATPSSSTTSSASELLSASSGGHDAPAAPASSSRPGARALAPGAGPRGGRVTKRKPRASRRPQTTYITADPANFRRMVQEITGLPVPVSVPGRPSSSSSSFPSAASEAAVPNWTTPAPACVLPTLDTSAFLLDRAAAAAVPAAPEDKSKIPGGGHASSSTATDAAVAVAAAAGKNDDDDSAALLELEALVCAAAGECGFPTLESWGII